LPSSQPSAWPYILSPFPRLLCIEAANKPSSQLSNFDTELKINVTLNTNTNTHGTSKSTDTAIPLYELDPDLSTLDDATIAEITKADLTCNPGGYTQADIRGIKAGIRELDKLDGFRTLEGKHCEWAACGMSAAIWWCNTVRFPLPSPLFLPLLLHLRLVGLLLLLLWML
jgi:hypothetical protein